MSPLDNGNRWAVLGVAVFMLGALALVARQTPALALVNESPSLPRGVYARVPAGNIVRGSTVAVPVPARARAYLASLGMPAEVALIKRVAGVGGDRICAHGGRLVTPTAVMTIHQRDRRGVVLPQWSECRRLAADEVFLVGETDASFDSRYFGAVRTREVIGVYREVLTW